MGYDDEGLYIRSFRKVIIVNFLSAFTVATEVTYSLFRFPPAYELFIWFIPVSPTSFTPTSNPLPQTTSFQNYYLYFY